MGTKAAGIDSATLPAGPLAALIAGRSSAKPLRNRAPERLRCTVNQVGDTHSGWSAITWLGVVRDLSSFVCFRFGMPCGARSAHPREANILGFIRSAKDARASLSNGQTFETRDDVAVLSKPAGSRR